MDKLKEYFANNAIGSSSLTSFYEAPALALTKPEYTEAMFFGHLFEDYVTDRAAFENKYQLVEIEGEMPDNIPQWIQNGCDGDDPLLMTPGGKLSKPYMPWVTLKAELENGKMPYTETQKCEIEKMAETFYSIDYNGTLVSEIITNSRFQVPVFWNNGEFDCKGLLDAFTQIDDMLFPFDIKTTSNLQTFERRLKSGYWIQDRHYLRGIRNNFPDINVSKTMVFIAVARPDKHGFSFGRAYTIDDTSLDNANQEYEKLISEFAIWLKQGKPPLTALNQKSVRLYF